MTRNPNLTEADNATYIMLDYPITSGTMFSNAANAITASYGYLPVAGGAANYYNQSIVYTVASGTKTLYFYGVPQFNSSWDYTYTLGTLNSMRAYLFYE
jgi:hypothetical protein